MLQPPCGSFGCFSEFFLFSGGLSLGFRAPWGAHILSSFFFPNQSALERRYAEICDSFFFSYHSNLVFPGQNSSSKLSFFGTGGENVIVAISGEKIGARFKNVTSTSKSPPSATNVVEALRADEKEGCVPATRRTEAARRDLESARRERFLAAARAEIGVA